MESDFTQQEWEICLKVLQALKKDPDAAPDVMEFKGLITKIYKTARKNHRREKWDKAREHDRELFESTQMCRATPATKEFPSEGNKERLLYKAAQCYICKKRFSQVHFFYHKLCSTCADLNYKKRSARTNLLGKTALVTGGRIKIGYQTVLKLLRDGARVIVTTRFPKDAAQRFSSEKDFADWSNRLNLYGLDLRNIPEVESFIGYLLKTEKSLEIIINNAAQTIKRPLTFYQHALEIEQRTLTIEVSKTIREYRKVLAANEATTENHNLKLSQEQYFPKGEYDSDGQQIDLRHKNSWTLPLEEVETLELLEVHLVNAIAPFLFNSKLKPLLLRSSFSKRFIVNVSAMEGQFYRDTKTIFHPHTNMAKASLNMMTRTCASGYAADGILMNSVDTGWITDENPHPKKSKMRENGFVAPLDIIDGASRIYDPIVCAGVGEEIYGAFLKDYQSVPW